MAQLLLVRFCVSLSSCPCEEQTNKDADDQILRKTLKKGRECDPTRWLSLYQEYVRGGNDRTVQFEKIRMVHEFMLTCSKLANATAVDVGGADARDARIVLASLGSLDGESFKGLTSMGVDSGECEVCCRCTCTNI